MKIENLCANAESFTGNVWKISCDDFSEITLVDAGTGDSWDEISTLYSIDKVVITHSHYDHVDNLEKIADGYKPKIYAYRPENLEVEAEKISEGDRIEICGEEFEVIHTPGHKDDSICLYSEEERILFAGDLIFPDGGFGRTDLEEGDRDLLISSIRKIADLDVEEMYCGHEPAATEDVNTQIERSLGEAGKHESKY